MLNEKEEENGAPKGTNVKTQGTDHLVEDREALQKQLIFSADQKVLSQGSDEVLDRENLKIQLIGGAIIDLDRLEVVCKELGEYERRFVGEYYEQIFRLNNWKFTENQPIAQKPNIVGKWTKEIIYSRFGKEVLPALELLNPYERIGIRRFKHHQYLNEEGLIKLNRFIQEAIDVMKICNDWYEFRQKLYELHFVPYQLDIYEEEKRKS
ncbi:MAG: P63C domain-containing protein [Imperialibacter sp.]|uniref:P63C domain-containing protein n=1 Tax=Imperialibacter sp. TaxID=2038411 RepID=UPI0032EECC68